MDILTEFDELLLDPEYIEESAWIEHIPFMFWLTKNLKPQLFVELGAHYGVSFYAFCQIVKKYKLDSKGIAIDNWKGDSQAGIFGDEVFEVFKQNLSKYNSFATFIREDFNSALKFVEDRTVDFAHIDGFHSFEAVKNDFNNLKPKLNEKSIVLFHDIYEFKEGFGVYLLWEELKKKYRYREFKFGHGLGVITTSKNLDAYPIEIQKFFVDDYFFQQLNQMCTILGSNLDQKFIISQLSKTKEDYTNEINRLRLLSIRLDKEIQNVYRSKSWRITEFLRQFKKWQK